MTKKLKVHPHISTTTTTFTTLISGVLVSQPSFLRSINNHYYCRSPQYYYSTTTTKTKTTDGHKTCGKDVDHTSSSVDDDDDDNHLQPDPDPVALTVWNKSLLLNCSGFTVFDGKGNLVFRVDNYVAANRKQILLMDAAGKPLLTIRRKKLSWGDNWQVYDGEASINPIYFVQKQANLLITSKNMSLAQVFSYGSSINKLTATNNTSSSNNKNSSITTTTTTTTNTRKNSMLLYQIEGSYAQRSVVVYNNKRQCVAEMKRKETTKGVTLGGDVFRLIILRPDDIDTSFAMALVILLDQMFGSSSS